MSEDTIFPKNRTLNLNGRLLNFSQTLVMGIVNYTPDSFYASSRNETLKSILKLVEKMLIEKADIIDLGAFSTRPNGFMVSEQQEVELIEVGTQAILKEFPETILSIDTFRSKVVKIGVESGALLINDISGGRFDSEMFQTVAKLNVSYVLMHCRGNFETMHAPQNYAHITDDIIQELKIQINLAKEAGISQIIIDPGFGFSKNVAQNFKLLSNLEQLHSLELPMLVGISRKSMIYKTLDITSEEALNGTTVLNTIAIQKGASILRVHDVKEALEVRELLKVIF